MHVSPVPFVSAFSPFSCQSPSPASHATWTLGMHPGSLRIAATTPSTQSHSCQLPPPWFTGGVNRRTSPVSTSTSTIASPAPHVVWSTIVVPSGSHGLVGGGDDTYSPGKPPALLRSFNNRDRASVLLRGALDHLHALVPSPGHGTQGHGREVRPGLHRAFVREPHEGVTAWCEPRPHGASSGPSEQNRRELRLSARRVQRDVRQVRRGRPVEAEHQP